MNQLSELKTPFSSIAKNLNLLGQNIPWLNTLRKQASEQFKNQGLPIPNKKIENWKYTSLWNLARQSFRHISKKNSVTIAQSDRVALLTNAYRVVIVDGIFSKELSQLENIQDGLTLYSLSEGVKQVQQQLGQQVNINKEGLTALNTMLMNDGVVMTVSIGQEIDKPIELLVINSGQTKNLAVHLRNIIIMEKHSKATFIEHYIGLTRQVSMTNVVTEVVLNDFAKLNHHKLQQESINSFHIATLAAKQAASSQWYTNNISLGAQLTRNDIHSQLAGAQAKTIMNGLYLVDKDQHVDNHTHIDHLVPDTASDELYKGVLDGNSRAIFNGKIMVHKDAQRTNAKQSNHNLLLSPGCEIDTKPEMEIYADDVRCSHGSAVGHLDEGQLFYLRARGLDEISARSLLTCAFAIDVLERISSSNIKQALTNIIEERLPKSGISE
ncbi:MAG: Fe-S cluster assembly protein SufD [Piscirickettsiaceae bacterium]|nr:Fe-S cluster assembly protein SufD [Piscirickettsiaceae bacterium]